MASTFEMTLAGKRYALASPLVREPIPDLASQWRSGALDYSDRQGAQYWEWSDLSGGIGLRIIDCNKEEDRHRTWQGFGIDTRFPGETTLGPLLQTSGTLVPQPSSPEYGRFLDIPGAVLFASTSASWKCTVWRNAATTWNRVFESNITNAEKGRDWAFPVPDGVDQRIYLGTGGALFSSPIGGTSFSACGSSFPARAIGYDNAEETLICQKTKDDAHLYGITGHPTTPVATDIAHMGGLAGDIVSFYDADGKFVPYISVFKAPSGDNAGKPLASLYTIDLIEGKVYPVADAPPAVNAPASAQTWKNICVWQGWIYMFLGDRLCRYRPGQWEGVPKGDGSFNVQFNWTAATYQAFTIIGMAPTAKWLYVYCKSAGGYDAAIVAVGTEGDWHAILRDYPPIGGDLGWSDDWTPERIYVYSYDTYGATPTMRFLEMPGVGGRPATTPDYDYAQTGWFTTPIFDGRYGEITGTALALTVIAENITDTELITVKYGLDGTYPATALGTIEPGVTTLDFPGVGSHVGVAFKTIAFQFTLTRSSDSTKTPLIRRIVLAYLKKPPVRYRYTASIEVKGTRSGLRSMETILAELETAYDATTLRELKYGRVTTNVNIVGLNFVEKPATQKTGQRNVYQIQVAMEEPI
jgi:hypothetical protein